MRPYLLIRSAALCVILLACATNARADADEQARVRYERAVKLYEEGVYDAALVELRRAYDLRPSYKLFYNMALSRVAMRDYAGALEDYQRYLREGAERIAADRRSAVQSEIERLEQRVARLNIKTDVSGAEVLVDDVLVGSTPLAGAVAVNSGVRRVVVRHPEYPAQTLRVSIAGAEVQELNLPLSSGSKPTAEPVVVAPREGVSAPVPPASTATNVREPSVDRADAEGSGWTERRALVRGVAWGTTGALAALAIALGVTAVVNDASIQDERDGPIADPADYESKATRTERMALASDVLTGAAVVAAGVSVWLTVRTRGGNGERDGGRASTSVALRPAGLSVRSSF
jgi:hypothetical protein